MNEYPKWVPVDGPGHAQFPGHVLVENEDQEREVLAGGKPPAELNPSDAAEPVEEGDKPIEEMSREEIIAEIVKHSITADVDDDQLRDTLQSLRDRAAGVGMTPEDGDDLTDAAGDKIAPDVAEEANKGADQGEDGRQLPDAKPGPATDARPDDAREKVADDKPAGNVTEQAATPPEHKKGSRKPSH